MATIYSIKEMKTQKDEEAVMKALEEAGIEYEKAKDGKFNIPDGLKNNQKLLNIIDNLGFKLK